MEVVPIQLIKEREPASLGERLSTAMTVAQLVEKLRALDQTAHIFTEGCDGMYNLRQVESVTVMAENMPYGGEYTYYDSHDDGDAPHCDGYLIH